MTQTVPFTVAELTDIRRFVGYAAYAAFGYVLSADMATLDTQCAGMSDAEQAIVRTIYLPVLTSMEAAINAASDNLDTAQAAVWTHNKNELNDRVALYNYKRRQLCAFIGVRPGDGLRGGGVCRT